MDIFGFFVRLTHRRSSRRWVNTRAIFTGKTEPAVIRTRMGGRRAPYNAYEIVYHAEGKERHGWYVFHPLPDPDAEDVAGTEIDIRYQMDKPFVFEKAGEDETGEEKGSFV